MTSSGVTEVGAFSKHTWAARTLGRIIGTLEFPVPLIMNISLYLIIKIYLCLEATLPLESWVDLEQITSLPP